MVREKIWSWYSLIQPYLFFCRRGGTIHILGLPQHFLWVRLRILWVGLISLAISLDNQSKKHSVWDITASMQWRVSFSHYSMSVSHFTNNVDVISMIGTIVFKRAECTTRNVKRLWPGSNHLLVSVVKPKCCCRVQGESLFSAAIDQFQW